MDESLLEKSRLYIIHQENTSNNCRQKHQKFVYKCDSCGLQSNCDVFSDDDNTLLTCKCDKCIKSRIADKKHISEEVQQKFGSADKENEKIQIKVKKLMKNIYKKDKIISELNTENARIKEQMEENMKRLTDQSLNLIELANINNRLKKEIEKKNSDILEFKSLMSKNELVKSNLMKDINFYKSELNAMKKGNIDQIQKYSGQEYEILQRKFYEIKIENNKLCRKFKEIRSGEENCSRKYSYHVLCKKFESVQQDMFKLKMENKKLKDEIKKNKQDSDDQTSKLRIGTTQLINEEIEQLMESKKQLEQENQNFRKIMQEIEAKELTTESAIIDLQEKLNRKTEQSQKYESEIEHLKMLCSQLENQINMLLVEKDDIMKQHVINEENNNKLKQKLDELLQQKSLITQVNGCQKSEDEKLCENCISLKQELEKIGYANLRLTKEKQNLQSNFQKLSIKQSKLTLKMDELELEKQKLLQHECKALASKCGNNENIFQQNVLLSKRLHNLLKKSEKLFQAHVIQQQAKQGQDNSLSVTSNSTIINEINDNLSYSKLNLETIENKLNEEEWKLNAALKHIRSVKEQIQMEL